MPCIAVYSIREKSLKGHPVGLFACPYCCFTYSRVGPDQSPEDMFRRGKIPSYGHLWQMKLHELWLDPDISTERIARRLGVDFNTVKQQAKRLALPPRLVLRKGSVKIQSERRELEQRRNEWLRLVELYAQDGITALIRGIMGARSTYNWLNKHDREWLLSHRPPKKVPQKTKVHLQTTFRSVRENPDKSRKEERDASTAQSIRVMAQQVMNSAGEPRRVTRNQLERAAPSLGWLLSRPNDFPLTACAFQEVRETREAFALRRVQWALQRYQEECTRPARKEFISRARVKKVLDIPSVLLAIEAALTTLARK